MCQHQRVTEDSTVVDAYGRRAEEYADLFGHIDSTHPEDRALILRWAGELRGPVLDVGCGPGQWTRLLTEHGLDVTGIDPVPRFVALARRSFPETTFRTGSATGLGVPDASLGGVLAWYSLIHLAPVGLPAALTALRRALRPGGSLLVGCFTGARLAPFPHAVAPAYSWPLPELSRRLADAGFRVQETHHRLTDDERGHGALVASAPLDPSAPSSP